RALTVVPPPPRVGNGPPSPRDERPEADARRVARRLLRTSLMPHITRSFLGLLVASLAVASTGAAQSPSTAARLSELRAQLYAYDAESTPTVIEALGPLALDEASPLASEACFLRTIATVDLSLIAR